MNDLRIPAAKNSCRRGATIVCIVASLASAHPAFSAGLSFAGVPLTPGTTVRANVPLIELEKSYVSEWGNAVPSHTVAVLAVPRGFDPRRTWPVLVVFSSSNHRHQNRDDLMMIYRRMALPEGWVLLAGDGPEPPRAWTARAGAPVTRSRRSARSTGASPARRSGRSRVRVSQAVRNARAISRRCLR